MCKIDHYPQDIASMIFSVRTIEQTSSLDGLAGGTPQANVDSLGSGTIHVLSTNN